MVQAFMFEAADLPLAWMQSIVALACGRLLLSVQVTLSSAAVWQLVLTATLSHSQSGREAQSTVGTPGGIIIAKDAPVTSSLATCNHCCQKVLPGQRIMVDDTHDIYEHKWWNHLECSRLKLFEPLDEGSSTFSFTSYETKKCAWCAQLVTAGKDQLKRSWMGYVHSHCNVIPKSNFVAILKRLQHRYPAASMPYKAHSWGNVRELCTLADAEYTQEGLSAELHHMHIKQEELNSLPIVPITQTPYVDTPPAKPHRWAVLRDEPEAESDAELSPVRHSGATQPTERSATSSSDSGSDKETLGPRGARHRAAVVARSGHNDQHRAAPTSKHRPHRRSGPASYRTYDASLPVQTAHQQRRQLGRSEALGDEDSASDGARTDSGYDSMDDFIVPDDDDDGTTDDSNSELSSSGDSSSAGDQSADGDDDNDAGREEAEAQAYSNQAIQVYAPAVIANTRIMTDPPSPMQSGDVASTGRDQQETQPYAPWESPSSTSPLATDDDAINLTNEGPLCHAPEAAVPAPPSPAAQLVVGCRRLCKRPQQP